MNNNHACLELFLIHIESTHPAIYKMAHNLKNGRLQLNVFELVQFPCYQT